MFKKNLKIIPVQKKITDFLNLPVQLKKIAEKVISEERISSSEAVELFYSSNLSLLGFLADTVKKKKNGNYVFYNRNFHIEPSNICINNCKFCSYKRKKGRKGAWEYSIDEILQLVKDHGHSGATEVHIVGSVHPDRDVYFYADMLKAIKNEAPHLHIKAFTATEIEYMCKIAGITIEDGLQILKDAGLQSMPGGGAEIFDETLRDKICFGKTSSEEWLRIHYTAHRLGIPSNATILYGLLENYEHRADHMQRLRDLQDKTKGFNAFIPLKFKHKNNAFAGIKETTLIEDLKNYAVSRIYLDNIPHIKAYWPMIGRESAQLALNFGVDDLDGTIEDSTKIYSMAGGEQRPSISSDELKRLINEMNLIPAERDSLYNIIRPVEKITPDIVNYKS